MKDFSLHGKKDKGITILPIETIQVTCGKGYLLGVGTVPGGNQS